MAKSYRAAIIGCGGISRRHVQAFHEQGNVKIVAACDISTDSMNAVCDENKIKGRYLSHEDLFKRERGIDLVSICTYPKAHADQVVAAAEAGAKAILCEKPMCLTLDEADAMIEACKKHDTKLVIAHRHRQNPNFTKARDLITEGAIGEPRLAWCYLTSCIIDNGTHIVDMIRYLLSDPDADWVMGHASRKKGTYYQESPAEESGTGLIAFKSGTRAMIEMGAQTPEDGFTFRVLGSDGVIEASQQGIDLIDRSGARQLNEEPNTGFAEQTREMIAWLEDGPEHRSTDEVGRATTELLIAMHESARLRELVELPLDIGYNPMQKRIEEGP
jgi:UDP-N-acetyl-2-amino-2-deoxyglucuronate dehydrogenase